MNQPWRPVRPDTDRTDRRVRRTRGAILAALAGLMQEKGYDAVTVADIIDRADIGRSTFYTHFTDKRHVLDASLGELATFLRGQRTATPNQIFGFSLALFEHAHEQRPLLRALLGRRGSAVVRRRIETILAELVREEIGTSTDDAATVPAEIIVDYVVGAYMALLARWLDDDRYSPRTMDAAFRQLVLPGLAATGHASAPEGPDADVHAEADRRRPGPSSAGLCEIRAAERAHTER
jgi:AcrR family transcriptional regulator